MAEKNLPWIGTRKIYPMGNGGFGILLPPTWAREKGIDENSEVLVIANSKVTIEPKSEKRIGEIYEAIDQLIEEEKEWR